MKSWTKKFSASLVACLACASMTMAIVSGAADDPSDYVAAIDGPGHTSGKHNCVASCPDGDYIVGQCFTGQKCCGYRDCAHGNEQNTCCNSGQTCNQDFDASPIINECIATP